MTTHQAFEKLINTKDWYKFFGLTARQAVTIKQLFKHNTLGLNSITGYLQTIGGVMSISIISPLGEIVGSYEDAFEDLLLNYDLPNVLGITDRQCRILKHNFKNDPSSLRISTMQKHLKKAGYQITVNWELPPEIK